MTQDEIIEMAREAGFFINDELTITSPFIEDICISPMLEAFAKLVAAKEREACAKVCYEVYRNWVCESDEDLNYPDPNDCIRAIRTRGEA